MKKDYANGAGKRLTLTSGMERSGRKRREGHPVSILFALSSLKERELKKGNSVPHIEIAMDRWFAIRVDAKDYEIPFADAVAEQIRANILAGKTPAGGTARPLDEDYLKEREGTGPRGVNTGATLATLRVELLDEPSFDGDKVTAVVMDQPHAPGQFKRTYGKVVTAKKSGRRYLKRGARWTYNPADPIIAAAVEELIDVLIAEDAPENWISVEEMKK